MAKLTVASVEKALRDSDGNIACTARAFGCTRSAVYNFIQRYTRLQEVLKDCRETMKDEAESSLSRAIRNGDAWAICFFLKTQAKDRGYVEKSDELLHQALERVAQLGEKVASLQANRISGNGHNSPPIPTDR
jgi:hypothetical protein